MLRLHPPHTIQIHTHLDIVALWASTGGEAGGDASPLDHFPWHITVWCGWPQLPCSSLHRLVLASSSCCCTLLWTPPICKCQPSREGGMAGRGLLFMWCYVMQEESMEEFVTTVVWKGTGQDWCRDMGEWGRNNYNTNEDNTADCHLNATSAACYHFEGLLEFHSRVWFVQRPQCGKSDGGLKHHWFNITL